MSTAVHGTELQGAFVPYQAGAMRPVPELGGYRSPLSNVYLCGSSSHPGPGVSFMPGRNAAQLISQDLGLDLGAPCLRRCWSGSWSASSSAQVLATTSPNQQPVDAVPSPDGSVMYYLATGDPAGSVFRVPATAGPYRPSPGATTRPAGELHRCRQPVGPDPVRRSCDKQDGDRPNGDRCPQEHLRRPPPPTPPPAWAGPMFSPRSDLPVEP